MFTNALRAYLKETAPRYMTKLYGYLSTLNHELLLKENQYLRGPYVENKGMMLLEHILGISDIDKIRKEPDQFTRYRTYLIPMKESLERLFDPVQQGLNKQGSFIDQAHPDTRQYIFPVSSSEIYSDLPFGCGWSRWKAVRPLRVASLLTNELTFQAYQDCLKYRRDPPTIAVFTIDVVALVLMYCAYLDSLDYTTPTTVPEFLHKYVVYPALQEDSVMLWVRNQYHETLLRSINRESSHKDYVWITANNGRIGSQYPQFISDAYVLMDLAKTGSLLPNAYLSSLKLTTGRSVIAEYKTVARTMSVPELRQYSWVAYMIQERWIDMILRAAVLWPKWDEFSTMSSWLRRDLGLLQASHAWSDISDKFTQTYIQTSLNDKLALIDNARAVIMA